MQIVSETTTKPAKNKCGPKKRLPSLYDDGVLDRLCQELAEGKSIQDICSDESMPHFTEVYRTMAKDATIASAIAQAREAQQEFIADEIVAMADKATAEDYNAVKLKIWARQWRAAKLAPKKYGDNQKVEINQTVSLAHAEALMALASKAREAKLIESPVIDVTPIQRFVDPLPSEEDQ